MADAVGNRNGPRAVFVYETDSVKTRNLIQDESVGLAIGNTKSTDGEVDILRASGKRPIEPRYILLALKSDTSVRKRAIVGKNDNTLFAADGPSEVTINSVVWVVTGRVGEKRSTVFVEDEE